jgi:hypothetical protein
MGGCPVDLTDEAVDDVAAFFLMDGEAGFICQVVLLLLADEDV